MDQELLDSNSKTPRFSINGTYVAKCVNVYDGDTAQFTFRISPTLPVYRFTCRLSGYNSAEINGGTEVERLKAQESKCALADRILEKIVQLDIVDFDKYGRPLVVVNIDCVNINNWMVESGYGVVYNGTGEKLW